MLELQQVLFAGMGEPGLDHGKGTKLSVRVGAASRASLGGIGNTRTNNFRRKRTGFVIDREDAVSGERNASHTSSDRAGSCERLAYAASKPPR